MKGSFWLGLFILFSFCMGWEIFFNNRIEPEDLLFQFHKYEIGQQTYVYMPMENKRMKNKMYVHGRVIITGVERNQKNEVVAIWIDLVKNLNYPEYTKEIRKLFPFRKII